VARLAVYRSMHNVRPGERHRPAREITLADSAVAYLRLCDVEPSMAWSTDRLSEVRRRIESEARLLHGYATEAECRTSGRATVDAEVRARIAARLATDPRYVAVQQFLELAREAEAASMTLVYAEE
jgi:hypothetical protein